MMHGQENIRKWTIFFD